jgi:hypothetical protein
LPDTSGHELAHPPRPPSGCGVHRRDHAHGRRRCCALAASRFPAPFREARRTRGPPRITDGDCGTPASRPSDGGLRCTAGVADSIARDSCRTPRRRPELSREDHCQAHGAVPAAWRWSPTR